MSDTVSIRNKSGQALYVPALNQEVDPDEVVSDVPKFVADSLTSQSIWEEVRTTKKADK